MKNLVTFTRNDRSDGALRFGQMDGDVVTDLTDDFAGSFDTLSDAANAGALDNPFVGRVDDGFQIVIRHQAAAEILSGGEDADGPYHGRAGRLSLRISVKTRMANHLLKDWLGGGCQGGDTTLTLA